MLTPEQLTACTEDIVELYRQLEDSIIQKIVKALTKGTFTEGKADLVLRLQQSGKLYDDIVKEVTKHSGLSDEAVRVLFEDASVQSVEFDNKIYKEAGIDVVNQMSPAALHVLEANIEKTGSFLKNLTKTTATASQQSFISACTLAEMQIESGALSYTEAVRQAIHNVIADGAEVIYPSGHRDKLDVAVRRAALTGVGQTTGEISRRNAEYLGCDLMEITAHFGARPSHAEWQGKIVSLSGREGYLSTADIGYGTGGGFKGWNCRHDWYPFFEGISKRAYSDKELEQKKNEAVTYNDKTMSRYDAEQKQRAMERQIRKERSELAALDTAVKSTDDEELKTSLKNDFDNLSVKLKFHEAKYTDFSYKTDLPPQKQRLQMYGFNRSVSQKAVHGAKEIKHFKETSPGTVQQYKRYVERLGENEVGSFRDFAKLKEQGSDEWNKLQLKYRYKGIDQRLLERTPSYRVMDIKDGVPQEYNKCALSLNPTQKSVVYRYSDGNGHCSAINTYAATGNITSPTAVSDFNELDDTIAGMSLPENTVVFRGTKKSYIEGLEEIETKLPLTDWKKQPIKIKSFASTSLFRDTAYDSDVEMTILVPKEKLGAGYINDISHHHLNKISNEYEVILQNNSDYGIIEAQYFKGKLFLVVEWLGVKLR